MTQTIVQGPEDPLLVLDHQGGSGNPTFLIQQDENAAAYIWWDQVNQVFNMGLASVGAPSLSISSNGTVSIPQLTAGGLLVQQGGRLTGGLVADAANITQLTSGNLLVQQGGRLNGGLVADNLLVSGTATANELVVQNGTRVTGGMEIDTLLAQNFTAGTVTVEGGLIDTQSMQVYGDLTAGNYLQFSSREIKENIVDLSNEEALGVLQHLTPVKYNLKANQTKKVHIGFIAENVHPSVASSDRKSVSVMDIVAVLTQVVKEQQKTVKEQQKTIDALVAKSH